MSEVNNHDSPLDNSLLFVRVQIEGGEESFVRDQTFVDLRRDRCSSTWNILLEIITGYARWLAIVYRVLCAWRVRA